MVLERLEALPLGRFHYKLLLVTGLGWLFDSMDTGLIAFILPVLAKEWGLAPGQMGLIGSIGLIGMALGAVVSGTIADRIGRKKVFTITVLLYSIASAFCALSWNYQSLLVFRFLVGFGLGGELPVAATLVSEYAPSRVRGRFIVLLESFWGLGWIAAACIAYFFIPLYGWRMAFLIGALPALYVCLIRMHMPESVRYLLAHGRIQDANAILGAPHAIEGEVVHGEERGRTIGFPTANPTFSEKTGLNERVVEAYCITDEWIDLYGHKVRVEFVGFLRPQVKFDGPDQLVDELKRNVEETKCLTA